MAEHRLLKSYVVIATTFMGFVISIGLANTTGVFYQTFMGVFQESAGLTSWIGALNYGLMCAVGPLANIFIKKFGLPACLILGGWLTSMGIFFASFAVNIYMVFVFLGAVTGVGCGFTYTSCLFKTTLTFTRWRAVATGVAMSGVGVGHFMFPFIITWLQNLYGWRGALLVMSALQLHVVLCGFILNMESIREFVEPVEEERSWKTTIVEDDMQLPDVTKMTDDVFEETKPYHAKVDITPPEACDKLLPTVRTEKADVVIEIAYPPSNWGVKRERKRSSLLRRLSQSLFRKRPSQVAVVLEITDANVDANWFLFTTVYLSTVLFCFGQSIVFTHVMAFASKTLYLNPTEAASLLSVIGISNIVGRITLGAIAHLPFVNVVLLYVVCNVLSATFTLGYAMSTDYWVSLSLMGCFGIAICSYGPVLNELIILIVGISRYTFSYGILMSAMALGTLLGAPMAGWLYDYSQYYGNSFYLGAAAFLADAMIVGLAFMFSKIL